MILIRGEQSCCCCLKQSPLRKLLESGTVREAQRWERCFAGSAESYWEQVCRINREPFYLNGLDSVIRSISQESLDLPWGGRKRILPELGIDCLTYIEVFAKNQAYKNKKRDPLCHNLVLSYPHSPSSKTVSHRAGKMWFKTSCVLNQNVI